MAVRNWSKRVYLPKLTGAPVLPRVHKSRPFGQRCIKWKGSKTNKYFVHTMQLRTSCFVRGREKKGAEERGREREGRE